MMGRLSVDQDKFFYDFGLEGQTNRLGLRRRLADQRPDIG
jgi:hypothetical protein